MADFNVGSQVFSGQVQFSGVAVQLPDFNELRYGLNLVPYSGNAGECYIGPSGVTASTGFNLNKGFTFWAQTDKAANLYVVSNLGGVASSLHWIGF